VYGGVRDLYTGFGLDYGYIDISYIQLVTTRDSAIADLYTSQFTVTDTLVLSVFTSRILATDFNIVIPISHTKSSLHRLIPFLEYSANLSTPKTRLN
jgi:hypothetical protein